MNGKRDAEMTLFVETELLFQDSRVKGRCLQLVFPDVSVALLKSLHSSKPNIMLNNLPLSMNLAAPTS